VVARLAETLTGDDKALLTLAQRWVPIEPRPFGTLASCLGLSEDAVIARLTALRDAAFIRKIGPVFEPAALGLASELIAARVVPDHLDRVGAEVASWPEVTHCYARDHQVNLWFAGIAPGADWFAAAAERVAGMRGVEGVWRLPTIRRFKIGVLFELAPVEETKPGGAGMSPQAHARRPFERHPRITDGASAFASRLLASSRLLNAIQSDLPLCSRPFQVLAEQGGVTEDELIEILTGLLNSGAVRRYGALISHRRLGIAANAMVVMRVPEDRIEAAGARLAENRSVSHCYQRPTFESFPYSLYAMVHGSDREACLGIAARLAESVGADDWQALFSTREYGKAAPDYARLVAAKGPALSQPKGGGHWR
jgi:DNA-binding Lrp family transcriptional regulator